MRVTPWVRWTDPDCLVRFTDRDGRWVLTGLRVESTERVDTTLLRSIPIGRIEDQYNAGATGNIKATGFGNIKATGLGNIKATVYGSGDGGVRGSMPKLGRIEVPPTRPYPETFYGQVAEVYRELLAMGYQPTATIATASNVPTTTVTRWIREARQRGYLPPGRKGRTS